MSAYTSPRLIRLYVQNQTAYTAFNNTSGTWNNAGVQLIRIDQGALDIRRNAPYTRFPVVTGSRSEVAGIRGRKNAVVTLRNLPMIPNGVTATAPDMDLILQSAFGIAPTAGVYSFSDTGYIYLSLFAYYHGITSPTNRAVWGGTVTRITWNFNGPFLTCDVEIACGYAIDSVGFSVFDTQAVAGLTTFPAEPSSTTVNGNPIAGFGNGYLCTIHSQSLELKTRVLSLTLETGNTLVQDVYGSPYPIAVVGDARRVSMVLSAIDDTSSALNTIKTDADTDNTTITASITAGNTAGNEFVWALNAIEPNAFNLRDEGPYVVCEIPQSFAHATAVGQSNDMTLTCQ